MANMIFDFSALTITAADFDDVAAEKDIYSTWKRLLLTGPSPLNPGAPPAFNTSVGGNPIGGGQEISPYFFVRNDLGWRLRPTTGSGELTINGNLFAFDLTLPLFESNGAGTVLVKQVVSPQSITDVSAVADLAQLVDFAVNQLRTDPITGKIILYNDDDVTVQLEGDLFEDVDGTIPYRGRGAERRGRMVPP
jgi:hypothetical protein